MSSVACRRLYLPLLSLVIVVNEANCFTFPSKKQSSLSTTSFQTVVSTKENGAVATMSSASYSRLYKSKDDNDDDDQSENTQFDGSLFYGDNINGENDDSLLSLWTSSSAPISPNFDKQATNGSSNTGSTNKKEESKFASGVELQNLRKDVHVLRDNLAWSEAIHNYAQVAELRAAITKYENRDPDFVYAKALHEIEKAKKIIKTSTREKLITKWTNEANIARKYISRFHLHGLWIGNFGGIKYELINVTYADDTLVARKVTGKNKKIRGDVLFTADLTPTLNSESPTNSKNDTEATAFSSLEPIELSDESALKWGVDELYRYAGKGYHHHLDNTDDVDKDIKNGLQKDEAPENEVGGQLIYFTEENFSFVWIPTRQHVFFGRPSPEVTMRLLRDIISEKDEIDNMRHHLEKCYNIEEKDDDDNNDDGCFNELSSFSSSSTTIPSSPLFRRIKTNKELQSMMEEYNKRKISLLGGKGVPSSSNGLTTGSNNNILKFFETNKWTSLVDKLLSTQRDADKKG